MYCLEPWLITVKLLGAISIGRKCVMSPCICRFLELCGFRNYALSTILLGHVLIVIWCSDMTPFITLALPVGFVHLFMATCLLVRDWLLWCVICWILVRIWPKNQQQLHHCSSTSLKWTSSGDHASPFIRYPVLIKKNWLPNTSKGQKSDWLKI